VSIYIQGKFGEIKTYLKECLTNNESNADVVYIKQNKEQLQNAA
jgi:hypothetical protein